MTRDAILGTVKDFILNTYLPGEDPRALTEDVELIGGGILNSLATLNLVAFLEERFGIEFQAHEVDPVNLGTLAAIVRLVQSKLPPGP